MKQTTKTERICINILVKTDLARVLSDFLIDREVRGCRPATLAFYRSELGIFLHWIGEAGARELGDITSDLLRAYFHQLGKQRKAVYQNFCAVKTWLRWAWEEYEPESPCPIEKVVVKKTKSDPKPGVTLEDANRLLDACKLRRNAARDLAILYFLIDTGVRRRECCALTIGQLKGDTMMLTVDGTKTGEARPVYLLRETLKAIRDYLKTRTNLEKDAPLFATEEEGFMSPAGLRSEVRRLCLKAGIKEQGLHGFRRLFGLETWRATHDLEATSKLLGHSNVAVTRRYLNLDENDLRDVHLKSSPVNKLKRKK